MSDDTQTNLTVTHDATQHDVQTVNGNRVSVDNSDTETNTATGDYDIKARTYVMGLIKEFDAERQRKEDIRANHRNFNRLMTLLFTLLAGLAITFGLYHGWFGKDAVALGPYSFVITVAGDTALTWYAYAKNY